MRKKFQQRSLSIIFMSFLFCGYFTPAYVAHSDNPYLPMNINIMTAQIDGVDLVAGDEIGIFDDKLCVGVGVVTNTIEAVIGGMLPIEASSNDIGVTVDNGFIDGNTIVYRFWDASAGKEGVVTATYPQSGYDEDFTIQGTAYVALSCAATDLALEEALHPENFQLQNVYPNPFNPITNITYELAKNTNVKIDVFDITGKLVSSLINEFQPAGHHLLSWDAKSSPSGIYLLQLKTNDHVETKKITCLK